MVGAQEVVGHYSSEGILDRVLAALRTAGVDLERLTPDDLAPVDHLHARGIQATQALATALAPTAGERVLDIGCGVGGPARWIAFSVDEALSLASISRPRSAASRSGSMNLPA